jgi:predicted permease
MMIIQHLFPVFALIALGAALKRFGLTNATFLAITDRLIYFIFFPMLLFWKIGTASQSFTPEATRFYLAVILTVICIYILSTIFIRVARVPAFQAGTFSQSCYRFNSYVGMAVILSVLGEAGVARFGVLIGLVIPLINVLSVTTLIWFSADSGHPGQRLRTTIVSILTNPLVIGCAAGLLYAAWISRFPRFIENTLRLGASITLPLALLSIGGSLTPQSLRRHLGPAAAGAVFKLVLLPVIGYMIMRLADVVHGDMAVGLLYFALPTSTAIYVLSGQLNSDTELASAAIVLSTALSFISLSVVLWLLNG